MESIKPEKVNPAVAKDIEAIYKMLESHRDDIDQITAYAKKITKGTKIAFDKVKTELKRGQ